VTLTVTGPGGSDAETKPGLVVVTSGAFVAYGAGSGGAAGVPVLAGAGDLTPGSASGFTLTLSGAAPLAPVTLLVGLQSASLPFKGQTLLVFPLIAQVPLGSTNAGGALTLPGAIGAGAPAVNIDLQEWVVDPTGVSGLSSSNGLELVVP
jgi:hypothetical protein